MLLNVDTINNNNMITGTYITYNLSFKNTKHFLGDFMTADYMNSFCRRLTINNIFFLSSTCSNQTLQLKVQYSIPKLGQQPSLY